MEEKEHSHNEPSSNHSHLEYLDQFLQLKCAPDLITMGLFPNAKEITETFAIWTALRRYILPQLSSTNRTSFDNRKNAIIVVGDGMTPRTAALCAYLTKGLWECYSIDPMLQYDSYIDMSFIHRQSITTSDHCQQWKTIKGLRMARAKIQTVSIQCQQAIVVMMHAHVTIEDAVNAIDASQGVVGIVTCPCCNWTTVQQEWLGQASHHQYIDSRLLSIKNQMNVWCFPQGSPNKPSIISTIDDKQSLSERNIWGIDTTMIEHLLSNRDEVKQRAVQLWPQIFSNGIEAFDTSNTDQSSNDLDNWPWSTTTWSPKDISPVLKSFSVPTSSSTDTPILSSWFKKPVLLVGTIGAMRRCKHTMFYELNSCDIPSEEVQSLLQLTSIQSSNTKINQDKLQIPNDTFPSLLKSADRIWTCVEYQRHRLAVASLDSTVERNNKKQNLQTKNVNQIKESSNMDRVNVLLSLSSSEQKNTTITTEHVNSTQTSSKDDQTKVNLFADNPKPRETLLPWATSLRPGDILVAYCQLGRKASHEPQLCLIDGILLFDSKLQMFGIDRRILR